MRSLFALRAQFGLVFSGVSALLVGALAPSAAAQFQGIAPNADQPGVNFDGSGGGCGGPILPLDLVRNPEEPRLPSDVLTRIQDVELFTGAFVRHEQLTSLPAEMPFALALSYNSLAVSTSASAQYNGLLWRHDAQMEIVQDGSTRVKLIVSADKFFTYEQVSSGSTIYAGVDGAAGFFTFIQGTEDNDPADDGTEDLWELTDHVGVLATFVGFDEDAGSIAGQLWRIKRPATEAVAYVGHPSNLGTARTSGNGWDANGRLLNTYDSSGRRFAYTYTTGSGDKRLDRVVVTDSSNVELGRVEFTYHDGSNDRGPAGALRTVTRKTPMSDGSAVELVQTKYYRYYTASWLNEDGRRGHPGLIKLVLDDEGARRHDWQDSDFDLDFTSDSDANLKPYSSVYVEYESNSTTKRVSSAQFSGQCGCSGGGSNGTYTFSYELHDPGFFGLGYDTTWKSRTIVGRPDGSYVTQYFDEEAQPLSVVVSSLAPTASGVMFWPTKIVRDGSGRVSEVWSPAAISAYTHSTGTLTEGTSGLLRVYGRVSGGAANGFVFEERRAVASLGASPRVTYLDRAYTWDTSTAYITPVSGYTYTRPLLSGRRVYHVDDVTSGTSSSYLTTLEYTTHSGQSLAVKQITETQPTVSTGNNGSGSTHAVYRQLRPDGQLEYQSEKTLETGGQNLVERRTYNADAQLTAVYEDANTQSFFSSGSPLRSDDGAMDDAETFTYDLVGRMETMTGHDGLVQKNYWSVLADRRVVQIQFPHSDDELGAALPARYSVANHAGKTEFSATIAAPSASSGDHYTDAESTAYIVETATDPLLALGSGIGTLTHVRTQLYDNTGTRLNESREYFLTPSSGVGTDGTNYDSTLYAYDGMGRTIRVMEPHSTIHRSVFEQGRGLLLERWVGTNDTGLAGSTSSGTSNMVKVEEHTYDGAAAGGNGYLTKRTLFLDDSGTNKRETTYINDPRGRTIVTVNSTAPHTVVAYDNLGRVTATAQYGSSSGLGSTTPPTTTGNRLAFSETKYDERGRVYQRTRHNITASTGDSADYLDQFTWYDERGRVIKVDGEQLVKYRYDRLERRTHEFVLATDNGDSTHADAAGLTGDTVLQERQTVYDPQHRVWMNVSIDRLYSNVGTGTTTGALDSNADGDLNLLTAANVAGRVQITAYWFDYLSREVDRADYGTNHGTLNVGDFDREPSTPLAVPTRSNDVLVTSTVYAQDGTVELVQDPMERFMKYERDAAGRTTAEIANYVSSGTGVDENQTVRYAYQDGLMITLTADLPGSEPDQVTSYYYGTKKDTPSASKVATGHLLRAVKYPDSTNTGLPAPTSLAAAIAHIDGTSDADIVGFAYNAQGEEIWRKDQAGGVIETTYDLAGRATSRAVTTLASGFDGAVRRIETAYDSLGRTETVTQYNAASAGAVIDQVKNVYDGWGNLTRFRQDHDSAVGAGGGSLPAEEVEYTFEKATSGRNTIRRTGLLLPDGEEYGFAYSTASTSFDDAASRVTAIQDAVGTDLAVYRYNGMGHLVSTYIAEPDIYSSLYGASGSTFSNLDRFDRVIGSKWTKDLSSDVDFFSVSVDYDRNSNVTQQDDLIYGGLDAKYTNDGLNRLTRAHEGTLSSGSITSPTRDQQWTLSQTGNWSRDKVDLNGDGDFLDAGELDDTRTHNAVNELLTRDTNTSGPAEFSLTYDAAGNMTDDGVYKYEWDAFYRLRKVRNQSNDLISEYWYNGLGFLVVRHQDTDGSGKVDGSDKKYHTYYDERWRQIATFRESDALPKEQFVYHCAGNGGWGGSSYIDSTLLRDKDQSTAWTAQADRTETRAYYCQNWRADVVVIVDHAAAIQEAVRYSAYGVPIGLPMGDADADGDCDADDLALVSGWIGTPTYNVRGDFNLDGALDAKDETIATDNGGAVHGRGVLSDLDFGNRKGYAGYEADAKLLGSKWHVRNRVLDSVLGRWLRRDPTLYRDGQNLYPHTSGRPVSLVDSLGLSGLNVTKQGADRTRAIAHAADDELNNSGVRNKRVKQAGRDAASRVNPPGGDVNNDPHPNFMRHCVSSCEACREYGESTGRGLADLIELKEDFEDATRGTATGKDDYRDWVANNNGFACCGAKDISCEDCCGARWRAGLWTQLVVAHASFEAYYSVPDTFADEVLCALAPDWLRENSYWWLP